MRILIAGCGDVEEAVSGPHWRPEAMRSVAVSWVLGSVVFLRGDDPVMATVSSGNGQDIETKPRCAAAQLVSSTKLPLSRIAILADQSHAVGERPTAESAPPSL
jgi:hypothetical protein